MERVNVRPIGRSIRGVGPGGTVGVSRRDARLLVQIGRAEFVDGADAPVEKDSKRRTPVKAAKKAAVKSTATKKAAPKKTAAKKATKKSADYARRDMRAD